MSSRSERILITGSRGFTGQHLVPALRALGHEVFGLVNEQPLGPDEVFAELTDAAQVREVVTSLAPTKVVHLAGITHVGHADPSVYYQVNVLGTLHLLEALVQAPTPPSRVILASSAHVYDPDAADPIDESAACVPGSHYAASKLAVESLAAVYRERLPLTVTRPFNYTGPGQTERFFVAKLAAHFARRAPEIELGNLDLERDFLDVRTVVAYYQRLLEQTGAALCTLNICSGTPISLRTIFETFERISGHSPVTRVNPQFVRPGERMRLYGSPMRLHQQVGVVEALSLEATLSDMLAAAAAG